MSEKECTKCGEVKAFAEYGKDKLGKHGLRSYCKACVKEYMKQHYQTNKEAIAKKVMQYYHANKESVAKKKKQWQQANKEVLAEYNKQYQKKRRANDPLYRMMHNLRVGLGNAMNGTSKPKRTMELLGCSRRQFRRHLSARFTKGMTLENYGEWHMDHIIPVSSFDHHDPEQVAICWHYTNLQPLWAEDNLKKSDKILTQ